MGFAMICEVREGKRLAQSRIGGGREKRNRKRGTVIGGGTPTRSGRFLEKEA